MINNKVNFFNMVEVVLAMGVIALAMTSVLALLPVGLNASRDAVALNYSTDAASNIVGRVVNYINTKNSLNAYYYASYVSSLPTSLPSSSDSDFSYIDTASKEFAQFLRNGDLSDMDGDGEVTLPAKISIVTDGIFKHSDYPNAFFVVQGKMETKKDTVTSKNNDFPSWIKNDDSGTGRVDIDFSAMVYIWKSQPSFKYLDTTASENTFPNAASTDYGQFTAFNVEMSWPLVIDYFNRERCYYHSEFTNPN